MLKGLTKIIVPLFVMYSLNCSTKVDVDTILEHISSSKSIANTFKKEIKYSANHDTLYIMGSGFNGNVVSRAVTISDSLKGKHGDVMAIKKRDGVIDYYNLREHKSKDGKIYIVPFNLDGTYPILSGEHNGAKAYLFEGKAPSVKSGPEA